MSKQERKVRSRWDRERRTVVLADAPSSALTQQQFKDECDMNRIVRNAMRGMAPKFLNPNTPHYGDFSEVPDLGEAYDVVARAEEAFMTLPAPLRAELNNDPRNITRLTDEQAERYRLTRAAQEPPAGATPPSPAPQEPKASKRPSKAGQAATAGTEPAED